MTGDGCRYCQPQEYIDKLSEWLDESREDLAATEARIPKWIPVSERLPSFEAYAGNDEFVFVIAFGALGIGEYIYSSRIGWSKADFHASDEEDYDYNVTHWMPLPDAPETEGKDYERL